MTSNPKVPNEDLQSKIGTLSEADLDNQMEDLFKDLQDYQYEDIEDDEDLYDDWMNEEEE